MKKIKLIFIIFVPSLGTSFSSEKYFSLEELEKTCDQVCGEADHFFNSQSQRCHCFSGHEYREYKRK